jgi:hypothetical protein
MLSFLFSIIMLSVLMLSAVYAEFCAIVVLSVTMLSAIYAEFRVFHCCAECCYAERRLC